MMLGVMIKAKLDEHTQAWSLIQDQYSHWYSQGLGSDGRAGEHLQ